MAEDPYHCANWSISLGEEGRFGGNDLTDSNWTDAELFNPDACNSTAALYCFEN